MPAGVSQRVLIVEDLEDARDSLRQLLELSLKLEVDTAADGREALAKLAERPYSLMITDLWMPNVSGMELIQQVAAKRMPVTVVVTTGHGSVKDAVEAMRLGAYDFLSKPYNPQYVTLLVERALRERALQDEVVALRAQVNGRFSFQNVLSKSPKMLDVFDLIGNVASTTSTVLIVGETGTGKEQIARAIHQASSAFRPGSIVAVNCAAVPESLLESELFGHEKGSFTGAIAQRKGRFEQAHKGTLFLDEVGDIPLNMQVKLLRVIQERRIERVGGNEPIEVDVRLIAATHQPLEKMVRDGTFREDLYYRLNVVRVEIPPLRDRPEDIPLLASHFVMKYSRGRTLPEISPEAMELLLAFPWPGNVRQLENAIERACVTARDGVITPAHLPPDVAKGMAASSRTSPFSVDLTRSLPEQLAELTSAFEERYLRKALRKTRGHVGKCAKISGLSRRSITDKIGSYKIDKNEFKRD
ncbi:MAG: sigma-54 dependent transcriptional regulator [Gemmataceae bacterium]